MPHRHETGGGAVAGQQAEPRWLRRSHIGKTWTSDPDRFILDLIQQMTGLNSHVLHRLKP
jgi:hypothetical protein